MYPEEYAESIQTSKINILQIHLAFCCQLLTVFPRKLLLHALLGSQYASSEDTKKYQSPVLMFFIRLKLQIKIIESQYKYHQ